MATYILMSLTIGVTVTLIGLAIVVLSLRFLKRKRTESIATGVAFALFGIAIIWLGLQGDATFHVKTSLTDGQIGILLALFVLSLFLLRGALDLRQGSMKLQDKSISQYQVLHTRFRIFVGFVILVWAVFLVGLVVFLSAR